VARVSATEQDGVTTVVFDLGKVLIDWDPRYLYRHLVHDPGEMDAFLAEVGFAEWNAQQDAGRPFAEAVADLAARHPARRALIEAYPVRFADSLGGEIPGSVAVLRDVIDRGFRALALSNWSAETFPHALARFPFLGWFDGIVLSGAEGVAKPDARLFSVLVDRHWVDPQRSVFIDDSEANIATAAHMGFITVLFTDAEALRAALVDLGVLER
jgi:2-haloacid dehalogenase